GGGGGGAGGGGEGVGEGGGEGEGVTQGAAITVRGLVAGGIPELVGELVVVVDEIGAVEAAFLEPMAGGSIVLDEALDLRDGKDVRHLGRDLTDRVGRSAAQHVGMGVGAPAQRRDLTDGQGPVRLHGCRCRPKPWRGGVIPEVHVVRGDGVSPEAAALPNIITVPQPPFAFSAW